MGDLRPAEHIQMLDCIQNRYIMFEFNKEFGTNIPEDLLYNWERKWIMMCQFVHTGASIWTQTRCHHGETNDTEIAGTNKSISMTGCLNKDQQQHWSFLYAVYAASGN